jgi:hypothetical protein
VTLAVAARSSAFSFASVVDVCACVDELPPDAAGELSLSGTSMAIEGAVFVERGRVCWAAARGLSRRLRDLIAAPARLSAVEMEALYDACKRKRAPLGEHLVGTGLVSASQLRSALLRHTSESLHALCASATHGAWVARKAGSYNPRFTFPTAEILASTEAESFPDLAERARAELESAFRAGEWGAAYVRSSSRAGPQPVALFGDAPDRVEPLLRLGRWACDGLDVSGVAHGARPFVAAVLDDVTLVAWRHGDVVVAGHTDAHGPARLLNRRARARRQESI